MNRLTLSTLCLAALAALACGEAPPDEFPQPLAPPPGLQQLSFTGVVEPLSGRLQLFMGPQAAVARIPESADGNVNAVAVNTVQVYSPAVTFTANNALYPAGCSKAAPMAMLANVEVFSGFTEQLRNVYANISAQSSGPVFCATNSLGSFAGTIGTTRGAYLYQPLNPASGGQTAIRRTVPWALTLPSATNPYWFTGDVWAEVIPQPPTGLQPADGAVYGPLWIFQFSWVTLSWTDDPLADGTNPENYLVARPAGGASLTIMQCGPSSAPFNPATCTTTNLAPTLVTSGTRSGVFPSGYWYQWSVRTSFLLPGASTRTLGSVVFSRHFSATP